MSIFAFNFYATPPFLLQLVCSAFVCVFLCVSVGFCNIGQAKEVSSSTSFVLFAVAALIYVQAMRTNMHWLAAQSALAEEEWCKQAYETLKPHLVNLSSGQILAPAKLTLIQQYFTSSLVCSEPRHSSDGCFVLTEHL